MSTGEVPCHMSKWFNRIEDSTIEEMAMAPMAKVLFIQIIQELLNRGYEIKISAYPPIVIEVYFDILSYTWPRPEGGRRQARWIADDLRLNIGYQHVDRPGSYTLVMVHEEHQTLDYIKDFLEYCGLHYVPKA